MNIGDKTYQAIRRLNDHPEMVVKIENGREVAYFRGRRLIGHDTPINGGVYVGAAAREAIVVDDSQQPLLQETYQVFISKVYRGRRHLLTEVFDFVREIMPPTHMVLEPLEFMGRDQGDDYELPLEKLIGVGGVCRHLPLLIGYILERMIAEKLIGGKVSIDRNCIKNLGGHAWVRYTSLNGEVYILDPVINTRGFKELMSVIRITEQHKLPWYYMRMEDL